MFGIRKTGDDRGRKVGEVRQWVREAHGVSSDTTVMVTELQCHEPGCPPLETVVAILHGPGDTRQAKIPRGIVELTRQDIDALAFAPPDGH